VATEGIGDGRRDLPPAVFGRVGKSIKNAANRIATCSQHTPGIEGYVFDGADGSQLAFWTVEHDAVTAEHVHAFDEWFVVVKGSYELTLDGQEVRVDAGQEFFIAKGTRVAGRVSGGTRTIHAFGGRRADRVVPGAK
jgi:mannose-6-phosphate isomerase-like protein (cupin superfamily)